MIKIEGLDQLNAQFEQLANSVSPDKLEPTFERGANIFADEMRRLAPEGPTRNLRRSIKVKKLKRTGDNPAPFITAVDRKIAPHAHLVEWGTSDRHHKSGKSVGVMPRKPFFRPAVDAKSNQVNDMIEADLGRLIDGAVK